MSNGLLVGSVSGDRAPVSVEETTLALVPTSEHIAEMARRIANELGARQSLRIRVRDLLAAIGKARRGRALTRRITKTLAREGLMLNRPLDSIGMEDFVSIRRVKKDGRPATPADGLESFGLIAIQKARPARGKKLVTWRLLAKGYDPYAELLARLRSSGRVVVASHGQNRRRVERESFPFYIAIQGPLRGDDLHFLRDACKVGSEAAKKRKQSQGGSEGGAQPPNMEAIQSMLERNEARSRLLLDRLQAEMMADVSKLVSDLQTEFQRNVDALRFDSVRQLATVLNQEEFGKLLDEQHAEYERNLEVKEDLIGRHQQELIDAYAMIEELSETISQEDVCSDVEETFATMEAVVELFKAICKTSPIRILDSALDSARRCTSNRRREVFEFLLSMRDLSHTLYTRQGSPGQLRDWFAAMGYEYALHDSQPTRTKYGIERVFQIDGEPVMFEEHVTLYPNSNDCVQIYFLRDSASSQLLVGYVGRHLRTATR